MLIGYFRLTFSYVQNPFQESSEFDLHKNEHGIKFIFILKSLHQRSYWTEGKEKYMY